MAGMDRRNIRRVLGALGLVLLLGACDFADNTLTDIALDANGNVVEIRPDDSDNGPNLSEVGQDLQVELADGTSIRLVDGRAIIESRDGFETSETVWEVDPDEAWWFHQFDVSRPGAFDVLVLPDGTAAVAGGAARVLERSAEGEWTPSVAYLRTLPLGAMVLTLAGVFGLLLALPMAAGPSVHGRGSARGAMILLFPFTAFSILFLHTGQFGAQIFFFVSIPFAAQGLGMAVGSIIRSSGTPRHTSTMRAVGGALLVALTATFGTLYVLWSRDMLSYGRAVWGCAIAASVLGLAGIAVLRWRVDSSSKIAPDRNVSPISWGTVWLLGVIVPGIVAFPLMFGVWGYVFDNEAVPGFIILALLLIGLAGLTGLLTTRARYQTTVNQPGTVTSNLEPTTDGLR